MSKFHLAGIVPLAGQPLDFKMDWHDSLMPIAPNYTAVQLAVHECAYAGCDTIWIVCNNDMAPLIRHRIGEWIEDPVFIKHKRFVKFPDMVKKRIPIFYVPIRPRDVDRRDCLSWGILQGALTAFQISSDVSKWIIPTKNYVAFPHGVYDPRWLREHRRDISSSRSFMLSHNGKTVQDGEYLGFTFDKDDFITCRRVIRSGNGAYTSNVLEQGKFAREKYPIDERYEARYFSLDKVFKPVIIHKKNKIEIPWYHNIGSWEGYCDYLGSEDRKDLKIQHWAFKISHEWNEIGVNDEEQE